MKNYLLRSIVLVQLTSIAIVGLLVFITQFINNKVYLYGYEPAEEFLKIVLAPFYTLTDNSQYGNSFFLLLHSLCYFLFFSMVVGNIIGVIWYYIKKKALKPLPWMEDLLLGEVIFIGLLVINYLIIYLTNHFSFELEKHLLTYVFSCLCGVPSRFSFRSMALATWYSATGWGGFCRLWYHPCLCNGH